MYHYIYKIINNLNGNFYIGKHSSNNKNDEYFGSGLSIRNAIKKHGKHNFTKIIIDYYNTPEELNEAEITLVTESLVSRQDCYNQKPGGNGSWKQTKNVTSYKHIGTGEIKRFEANMVPEGWVGVRKGLPAHENLRKSVSESNRTRGVSVETRETISKLHKGRKWWNNGELQTYQNNQPGLEWKLGMIKRKKA